MNKKILVLVVLALLLVGLSTTLASACPPPGTGTPGYWKNHPGAWPMLPLNSKICAEAKIDIGGVCYTRDEAIEIMNTSGKGDKTYTMFNALVAAKLNRAVGNDVSCILPTIWQADYWMSLNGPVGANVRGSDPAWTGHGEVKYEMLDDYNNGELCAPSRDDLE